jgi:hypothetical protein
MLVRNIISNGESQVYWQCLECLKSIDSPTKWISHSKLREHDIDPHTLPVIENYSGYEVCAVCGEPGTELHHWAPRHLFSDEADQWPTSYLCRKHHNTWHDLVTPNMGKRRRPQEI